MALVVKDRVQETSTTTGTGTFTLAGAVSGFQSFSVIGNANTTYYAIVMGTEWEVGLGTYTSSGTTLSRDTVLESSNSGSLVNFSAGTKNVFVTYPAEKSLYLNGGDNAIALGTPASATLTNATGLPIATGVSGLGTGVATFLATPSSANLASAITNETGSGSLVFATSPTLVTPVLGTPSSGTLTSCTGLPLSTGVTGTLPVLNGGTGVTTSTGSGNVVLSTSPTLVTPVLGTPSSGTLTSCTGLPLTTGVTGTLPVANFPAGSVLQVVQGSYNTEVSTTSSTFINTGITASITPSSSSNKILVLMSVGYLVQDSNLMGLQLLRDATVLQTSVRVAHVLHASYYHNDYLDSPATTSSTTYKIQFNKNTGNAAVTCWNSQQPSTITLMEIKG